ncbi:MAG: CdaR family protein [Syntrophomonas sp.]|uniref:CdaR family protein n=1 Tax=Syntrophomonas sp. TaxID=2053627 RepID=UPI002628B612|nr:CdaR family protein [Syntrophomonas sp.]MDD2510991.1 CdaR family protein [Syntrophomonas sp.]MDD3878596.1 CdaR family protein [Syntrophomonas sp.]MDD4627464.1 CdaR family protein [Syntrophomonas sp.]
MISELKDPKKRTGLKLISLIIAVLLWLYVVSQGATTTPQELIKTPLKYHNLGAGLSASGPDTVSLRLWGSLKKNNDTIAFVDLSGLGEGIYELPVNVKPVKGAMFTTVEPDKVEVILKGIQEKELSIKYEIIQPPPPAYDVLDVVITPAKCLLQGDEEAIKKVKTVKCQLSLQNREEISAFYSPLLALDAGGRSINEGIRLIPEKVKVNVAISQKKAGQKVIVKLQTSGNTAEGFQLRQLQVEPDIITILGAERQVADIKEINTKVLDLEGRKESFSQEAELMVPEGMKAFPSRVMVYVEIGKIDEKGGKQE